MKELIFSIEDIFNDYNQNGCLAQYDVCAYHIPAYQRGYKWASTEYGAVSILLEDLWSAFDKDVDKEYYLQYITVKKIELNNKNYLEVIDGQQRLTTLSVLLSVFSLYKEFENISEHKLDYAIRSNFFESHIYNEDNLQNILQQNWKSLSESSELNKQDIFYLHGAARKCDEIIKQVIKENKQDPSVIDEFYDFIVSKVKVIVNSVEAHISSETVFKNLNSNKVPLTEAELIKGLLITKVARKNEKSSFKEVSEIRMNLGRHWDEISRWANETEINHFFFNNKGIIALLELVVISFKDVNKKAVLNSEFPLFNYVHSLEDTSAFHEALIEVTNILKDWHQNNEIYNALGFCRFVKGSGNNNLKFLSQYLRNKKSKLILRLTEERKRLLGDNIEQLYYGDHDNQIHAVLLFLSVFPQGQDVRFNFLDFTQNKWSIEHIFPQSPFGKKQTLTDVQIKSVIDLLKNDRGDYESIISLLSKSNISENDINQIHECLKFNNVINSIGNLCLLTSGNNASHGNLFFDEKRINTLKHIQNGSFVPKHTFDVFSKMFKSSNKDLTSWTKKDIKDHITHINKELVV